MLELIIIFMMSTTTPLPIDWYNGLTPYERLLIERKFESYSENINIAVVLPVFSNQTIDFPNVFNPTWTAGTSNLRMGLIVETAFERACRSNKGQDYFDVDTSSGPYSLTRRYNFGGAESKATVDAFAVQRTYQLFKNKKPSKESLDIAGPKKNWEFDIKYNSCEPTYNVNGPYFVQSSKPQFEKLNRSTGYYLCCRRFKSSLKSKKVTWLIQLCQDSLGMLVTRDRWQDVKRRAAEFSKKRKR